MTKRLVIGGDPEQLVVVPKLSDFKDDDFIDAPTVETVARKLIETCDCFVGAGLADAEIVYLWKKKGAESPRRILGQCQKPSGLLRHFSEADFVIWLAANNVRGFTEWQFEALIFHELKHALADDEGPKIVPHDFEGFAEEIARYGCWKSDITRIAKAVSIAQRQFPFEHPEASAEARVQ